jgi:hypothetical protein
MMKNNIIPFPKIKCEVKYDIAQELKTQRMQIEKQRESIEDQRKKILKSIFE